MKASGLLPPAHPVLRSPPNCSAASLPLMASCVGPSWTQVHIDQQSMWPESPREDTEDSRKLCGGGGASQGGRTQQGSGAPSPPSGSRRNLNPPLQEQL